LWIIRRNERDIIHLYNSVTPYVQIITGCSDSMHKGSKMLNFGYWTQKSNNPSDAQKELCTIVGEFSEFRSAQSVVDVGSGFSAPAFHWKSTYDLLDITCVNINPSQLRTASNTIALSVTTSSKVKTSVIQRSGNPSLINASAVLLPFTDGSTDRVVALESAQHFKRLICFVKESKRILKPSGLVIIAIPTIRSSYSHYTIGRRICDFIHQFRRLGILYFTWASEHYTLEDIASVLTSESLSIQDVQHIGHNVYEPLADYCIRNRKFLKEKVKKNITCSSSIPIIRLALFEIVEYILYKSSLRMKNLSQKGIIDYILIKAEKSSGNNDLK
jgi:ubiquinone/menaquinone biosynthesis C-methylase UbiE